MNKKVYQRLLTALILLLCQPVLAQSNGTIVKAFVAAFNDKDVDSMLSLATEDVKWMSVSADIVSIETADRQALRSAMQRYFNSMPTARSEVRQTSESGGFVYSLEAISWTANGTEKSQCSMAVYELNAGKIKNVWYFPSHACSKQ